MTAACLLLLLPLAASAGPTLIDPDHVDAGRAEALLQGRRLALLVGPDGFDDAAFAPLRFTDDDALALSEVLQDPARGDFDQVWTLTTREQSAALSVRRAMDELAATARSPDDTVFRVLLDTRHPRSPSRRTAHPVPGAVGHSGRRHPHTALPHDEVLRWLDALPSRRKVLLLATCHSGQGKSALSRDIRAELESTKGAGIPPLRQVSEATVVIGVCAFNETARESEDLGHDIYTAFFLDALETGDTKRTARSR